MDGAVLSITGQACVAESKRTLQTSTNFIHARCGVKTDSTNHYKLPTRFAVVKTDSPRLYKPPTHFALLKTDS